MNATTKHIPFEASHPGSLLLDEIKFRNLNQKEIANQMEIQPSLFNEIIKGKRALTADIAILLEKILEIPADYWMRLQSQYEIDLARIKEKNIQKLANIESWGIIKNYVPTSYFRKNNYLKEDLTVDIKTIKSIYEVDSIDMLVQKTVQQHFAYHRKSEKLKVDDKNMLAWNMLAKYEVKNQPVNSFNDSNIPSLIKELKEIFYENTNTINRVKAKLNQYGIKFVLVAKIEKAPIDGYTFWSENNPAIAMTIRHKRIDNFAFTIMHELGHIDLHLKHDREKHFFDLSDKKGHSDDVEKEADSYAQSNLISTNEWEDIIQLPVRDDHSIKVISEKHKINPAIILGRMSYEAASYAINTSIDKTLK